MRALQRWIAALPAPTYTLRLKPTGSGPILSRRFTAEQLVRALPWLRHKNTQGFHVYARPGAVRHVLLDDADADIIDRLSRDHRIAAIVETSPYNYQAYVTVSDREFEPELAGAAARLLAQTYGTDRGATGAYQLGRLPGLTNRKPAYEWAPGKYWYVRVVHTDPGVDRGGFAVLVTAHMDMQAAAAGLPQPARAQQPPRLRPADPPEEYEAAMARVVADLPDGGVLDRSRVDYAIARRLLARGADGHATAAVLAVSPKAQALSPKAQQAYIGRTMGAAQRAVQSRPKDNEADHAPGSLRSGGKKKVSEVVGQRPASAGLGHSGPTGQLVTVSTDLQRHSDQEGLR